MIAGLVLAAGAGTRFDEEQSKLLAALNGRPLLEHVVDTVCSVRALERVAVVLGARAEEVVASVNLGRAEPVLCADWAAGQAASLRCGLDALSGAERVIVMLGDEPRLPRAVIERMLSAPAGARACYGSRPGHPVVLGEEQIAAVPALRGDQGARSLLQGGPQIECSDLWDGTDVDTPEDLEAIRHEARAVV